MKIVIVCAGSKRAGAGLMKTVNGTPVMFVGNSQHETVPSCPDRQFAKPDDFAECGKTWRERLCDYNKKFQEDGDNPCGLLSAGKLYQPKDPYREIYSDLVNKYGIENVYILSAGWGLVSADFLLPNYDITYTQNVKKEEKYKCRQKRDGYKDFNRLPNEETDRVVFFGGKSYLKPFCELTEGYAGERIVFYHSKNTQKVPGIRLINYPCKNAYTWVYAAAQELIDGKLVL